MKQSSVTDLYELGLLPRTRNTLLRGEVLTIADLAKMSDDELLAIYQIGPRHVEEIRARLAEYFSVAPENDGERTDRIQTAMRSNWPFAHLLTDSHLARLPDAENRITRLGLSLSTTRLLVRANVLWISQLARLTDRDLASIRGLGPSVQKEIEHQLTNLATRLSPESALPGETAAQPPHQVEHQGSEPAERGPLALLRPHQRRAVELRFGLRDGQELTLAEVGSQLGLTRERVRQMVNKALDVFRGERTVRDSIADVLREIDHQGGVVRGVDLQPWMDRLLFPSVHPRGAVELMRALSTPVVIMDVIDDWLCLYDVEDRGKAFIQLILLCKQLARERATYPLDQLVTRLQGRIRLPDRVKAEFIVAFLRTYPSYVIGLDGMVNLTAQERTSPTHRLPKYGETLPELSATSAPAIQEADAPRPRLPRQSTPVAFHLGIEYPEGDLGLRQRPAWDFRHPILDQWEHELSLRFSQISLVGEAMLSAPACLEVGRAIGAAFAGRPMDVRSILETRYPATFATFLVSQGVHGYEKGSYWPTLEKALGVTLDSNWASALGHVFENILEAKHLPLFPDMRDKSVRYLSLILAHGGIPQYCLGDFFSGVVKPSLRAEHALLDLETRLAEVLAHYNGDKPVQYFLENGGKVALDFYQRACDMFGQWMENGSIATDQGLPDHVVRFFADWAPQHAPRHSSTRRDSGTATGKAPELILEPWGQGLVLRLYAQEAANAGVSHANWSIAELSETVPVRISFGRTVERDIVIRQPTPEYHVTLQIGEDTRSWTIRAYPPDVPIMAFHGESGRRLPRLTPEGLYVLHAEACQINALKGDAICTETLPGTFSQWVGEGWDLSAAQAVELVTAEGQHIPLGLRNSDVGRPYLRGEPAFSTSVNVDEADGYVDRPPMLHIPVGAGQADGVDERGRWTLSIHSQDDPARATRYPLASLPATAISVTSRELRLDLSDSALLGPQSFGLFKLRLTGPLGRDREFSLACLPRFRVMGLESLYLPGPIEGPRSAIVQIQLGRGDRLELAEEVRDVQVRSLPDSRYEVKAGADVIELPLLVVHERADGRERRVPVMVTLPRLRWRLAGAGTAQYDWAGQALQLPLTTLLDEPTTTFVVHAPGASTESVHFALHCVDADEQTLMVLPLSRRGRAPFWQSDLARLHETWRHSPSSGFRLVLIAEGLQTSESRDAWLALQVSRTLLAQDLDVQITSSDTSHRLDFRWQQPWPVRDRVALLWPVDRPWDTALVFPVTEDSIDALTVVLPRQDVRVGRYRAQFVARNPWSPLDLRTRPELGAPSSIEVTLGTVEERLIELETASTEREAFLDDLERACIAAGQGTLQPVDLSFCLDHIALAEVGEWPTLARLVQDVVDQAPRETLGRFVFKADSLQTLRDHLAQGELAQDSLDLLSTLAPECAHWSDATCQTLAFGLFPEHTEAALRELARRDIQSAMPTLLEASTRGSLSEDDLIQLLTLDREEGLTALERLPQFPRIQRLRRILENQASRIRNNMWISTNIGHGQITRIASISQGHSVEEFMDDETDIVLHVSLHRMFDPEWKGESVQIDLRTRECVFPRAKRLFACERCGLTTGNLDIYKTHLIETRCGGQEFAPPRSGQIVVLKDVSFNPPALRHESR